MERWICARRIIRAHPDALTERLISQAPELLQRATGQGVTAPDGDGQFRIQLTTNVAGRVQHRSALATIGEARPYQLGTKIPLEWKSADAAGLFPTFDGAIEIERADMTHVTLAVIGTYQPPGGPLGSAVDRTMLRSVAEYSAEKLMAGLATVLTEQTPTAGTVPTTDLRHLTVADVMSVDPVVLQEDMSLRTGANLLLQRGISGAPVVDDDGEVVGVLSERDLLDKVAPLRTGMSKRTVRSWRTHDAMTVGAACTRPAHTTQSATRLRDAALILATHDIRRLVVMRGARVVGMVTLRDMMKALVRDDEDMLLAIEQAMADPSFKGLDALLEDGVVRLEGSVKRLSELQRLRVVVRNIDGVLGVEDDEVDWRINDVDVVAVGF